LSRDRHGIGGYDDLAIDPSAKLHNTPLILAGRMYADLVAWSQTYMLRPDFPLVRLEDLAIPLCVEDGPTILRTPGQVARKVASDPFFLPEFQI
jgi:hypothetical protein